MPAHVRPAEALVLRAEEREAEARDALAEWEARARGTGREAQVLVGRRRAVKRVPGGERSGAPGTRTRSQRLKRPLLYH